MMPDEVFVEPWMASECSDDLIASGVVDPLPVDFADDLVAERVPGVGLRERIGVSEGEILLHVGQWDRKGFAEFPLFCQQAKVVAHQIDGIRDEMMLMLLN